MRYCLREKKYFCCDRPVQGPRGQTDAGLIMPSLNLKRLTDTDPTPCLPLLLGPTGTDLATPSCPILEQTDTDPTTPSCPILGLTDFSSTASLLPHASITSFTGKDWHRLHTAFTSFLEKIRHNHLLFLYWDWQTNERRLHHYFLQRDGKAHTPLLLYFLFWEKQTQASSFPIPGLTDTIPYTSFTSFSRMERHKHHTSFTSFSKTETQPRTPSLLSPGLTDTDLVSASLPIIQAPTQCLLRSLTKTGKQSPFLLCLLYCHGRSQIL